MKLSTADRRQQALDLLTQLAPGKARTLSAQLDSFSSGFFDTIMGYAFTDVLSRPGLALREREMITLAALIAMGNAPDQLEFHLQAALNIGISQQEIIEILLQMSVYAGIPACLKGVAIAQKVLATASHTPEAENVPE